MWALTTARIVRNFFIFIIGKIGSRQNNITRSYWMWASITRRFVWFTRISFRSSCSYAIKSLCKENSNFTLLESIKNWKKIRKNKIARRKKLKSNYGSRKLNNEIGYLIISIGCLCLTKPNCRCNAHGAYLLENSSFSLFKFALRQLFK